MTPSVHRPAAVLWDMDGTLVDTEPYWFAVEREIVGSFGNEWPDHRAHAMVGFDLTDSAAYMREHGGVELPSGRIVELLLEGVARRISEAIPWQPGARELLGELNELGVPCALVTMSWAEFAGGIVDALPAGSFVTAITGDAVPPGRGKPHPEPYLMGAAAVGCAATDCVAIEDSPTGVRSALDAGCRVLGVPNVKTLMPEPKLTIASSLAGVTAADLARLPW
ncbi:MAG TPA: HAD family phosphatase [Ilumatobacter sp.]|nr:HAD family phosphatase [Ilumatobacter sp.]